MILINGADGNWTGWCTAIKNNNSHNVITNCRRFIQGQPFETITMFHVWKGTVVKEHDVLFSMLARWLKVAPMTVEVVELPLEVWTEKYKKHPETLFELKTVREYTEHHKINSALSSSSARRWTTRRSGAAEADGVNRGDECAPV